MDQSTSGFSYDASNCISCCGHGRHDTHHDLWAIRYHHASHGPRRQPERGPRRFGDGTRCPVCSCGNGSNIDTQTVKELDFCCRCAAWSDGSTAVRAVHDLHAAVRNDSAGTCCTDGTEHLRVNPDLFDVDDVADFHGSCAALCAFNTVPELSNELHCPELRGSSADSELSDELFLSDIRGSRADSWLTDELRCTVLCPACADSGLSDELHSNALFGTWFARQSVNDEFSGAADGVCGTRYHFLRAHGAVDELSSAAHGPNATGSHAEHELRASARHTSDAVDAHAADANAVNANNADAVDANAADARTQLHHKHFHSTDDATAAHEPTNLTKSSSAEHELCACASCAADELRAASDAAADDDAAADGDAAADDDAATDDGAATDDAADLFHHGPDDELHAGCTTTAADVHLDSFC